MFADAISFFLIAKQVAATFFALAIECLTVITNPSIFFIGRKQMAATFSAFRVERPAVITQSGFLFLAVK
jgi:hypothetical protein